MKISCAVTFQNQELLKLLLNKTSTKRAEFAAIDIAMRIITDNKSSKSVLQASQNKDTWTALIIKLVNKMNTIFQNNSIILTCIPLNIRIQIRESWNKLLLTDIKFTKVSEINVKQHISILIHGKNNGTIKNQIFTVYNTPYVSRWQVIEETEMFSRLPISRTHIIHSHHLKR